MAIYHEAVVMLMDNYLVTAALVALATALFNAIAPHYQLTPDDYKTLSNIVAQLINLFATATVFGRHVYLSRKIAPEQTGDSGEAAPPKL
jgi:Na+-transporting NADH:ubiquinone oxidoreductase subunit NqrB